MANPNPVVKFEKANDGRLRFVPTVGVAKAVFDYVQKNSGCARTQAIDALIAQGYKKSSVASLITQNIRAQNFRVDGYGRVHCDLKEYTPAPSGNKRKTLPPVAAVKQSKAPKAKPKAVKATKPKAGEGIAALKVDTGMLGVSVFDPKEFLNTLSIMQARALYDELKQVFGVF